MFEISIQKNIKDYKGKAMFGFTWRQIICGALAIGVNTVLYFVLKPYVSGDLLGYPIMIIAVVFFGIGFYQKDGMPLERYMFYVYETTFKYPRKRYFRTMNLEETLLEEEYQRKLKRLREIDRVLDGKKHMK